MEEGVAFSQALIHQRIASSGLRGFGVVGVFAFVVDGGGKYAAIEIYAAESYT